MSQPQPRKPVAAVAIAAVVTVVGVLPMFLTGALAVQMRADLGFDLAALGFALAIFLGFGSASSVPGGRLADRFGATTTMRIAAVVAMVAALLIAVAATSWLTLMLGLAVSGMANGFGQPASNLFLTQAVPAGRQGLAFGVKQSAAPMAALLGGLAVPALALTVGWRWAFAGSALVALFAALSVPRVRPASATRRVDTADGVAAERGTLRKGPMLLLAAGGFFGFAAASALTGFLVDASVQSGFSEASGGLLLSAGSLIAISVRLFVGMSADRRQGRHLVVVSTMLAIGCIGFGLIATGGILLILVGTVVAFSMTWGWSGLYFFSIVRMNPQAPGAAGGVAQAGSFLGGVGGPIMFGILAAHISYTAAWWAGGVWSLLAGVSVWFGRRWDMRRRALSEPAQPSQLRP